MTRVPQLYNSVRYEQKPRRWLVRYYDMYPLDPQDRLTIKRAVVTAKTSDEAADIMAVCGKEIIDVELQESAQQSVHPTWGRLGNFWTGSRAPHG